MPFLDLDSSFPTLRYAASTGYNRRHPFIAVHLTTHFDPFHRNRHTHCACLTSASLDADDSHRRTQTRQHAAAGALTGRGRGDSDRPNTSCCSPITTSTTACRR